MLLADGVYSIVAYTSVPYSCVSNERLIFLLVLKYIDRNMPFRNGSLMIVRWFCLSKAVVDSVEMFLRSFRLVRDRK